MSEHALSIFSSWVREEMSQYSQRYGKVTKVLLVDNVLRIPEAINQLPASTFPIFAKSAENYRVHRHRFVPPPGVDDTSN